MYSIGNSQNTFLSSIKRCNPQSREKQDIDVNPIIIKRLNPYNL